MNAPAAIASPDLLRFSIVRRIEATLERVRWQRAQVRGIYLTEADHDALDAAYSKANGGPRAVLSFGDHLIFRGERSAIYSTCGVAFYIPKRLSPRTAAPPAKARAA